MAKERCIKCGFELASYFLFHLPSGPECKSVSQCEKRQMKIDVPDAYEDVPMKGTSVPSTLKVGFVPNADEPTVGVFIQGNGVLLMSSEMAREIARRLLEEADKSENIAPHHIYMVKNYAD